jgi:hypothetical protein
VAHVEGHLPGKHEALSSISVIIIITTLNLAMEDGSIRHREPAKLDQPLPKKQRNKSKRETIEIPNITTVIPDNLGECIFFCPYHTPGGIKMTCT